MAVVKEGENRGKSQPGLEEKAQLPQVCVSLAKGLNFSGSPCARCKMGTVLSPVLGFVT